MNQTDDIIIKIPRFVGCPGKGCLTVVYESVPTKYRDVLYETAEHQLQWLIQHGMRSAVIEESRTSATVLIAALTENTTDIQRLSDVLELGTDLTEPIAENMKNAELWVGDEIRCEHWFHKQNGMKAFSKDLMVADGRLLRYRTAYGLFEYVDPFTSVAV